VVAEIIVSREFDEDAEMDTELAGWLPKYTLVTEAGVNSSRESGLVAFAPTLPELESGAIAISPW
jgi:hypothetical protein